MDKPPSRIFKYEPFSLRAVQNLKQQSVFFNSPNSFNDPFDCAIQPRIRDVSDSDLSAIVDRLSLDAKLPSADAPAPPELREPLKRTVTKVVLDQCNDFNNQRGVTCFSEVNDNMLMWSHYGGQHRGFCLEFDTKYEPFSRLRKVTYSAEIPKIDPVQLLLHNNYDTVVDLFCTKSNDWAYEREWRVLHAESQTLFGYSDDSLRSIYFGAKMSKQDIDMICLILHGQNPHVKLYRGKRSDVEFKIMFERFSYTPYTEAKRKGLA